MKAEYLVVDSGGFIAEDSLWELGQNLFTLNEVIAEIKDTATRRRLQVSWLMFLHLSRQS